MDDWVQEERDSVQDALAKTDFPRSQEIRRLLACLGCLRRYGLDGMSFDKVVSLLREERVRQVGVRQYIYDVLKSWANEPVSDFRLWRDGQEIRVEMVYWLDRPLVEYLAYVVAQGGLSELPDRVSFDESGDVMTRNL